LKWTIAASHGERSAGGGRSLPVGCLLAEHQAVLQNEVPVTAASGGFPMTDLRKRGDLLLWTRRLN
jgi:hypothetical protein